MKNQEQYYDDKIWRLVPFRLLSSYKMTHRKIAEKKGIQVSFENAKTLTQARRILWGTKKKTTVNE